MLMPFLTKYQWERSALLLALVRGDVDVMKVLIERGADVNTQNKVIMHKSLHYTSVVALVCTHPKESLVILDFLIISSIIVMCSRLESHYTCL